MRKIFSPLAIICALCCLYACDDGEKTTETAKCADDKAGGIYNYDLTDLDKIIAYTKCKYEEELKRNPESAVPPNITAYYKTDAFTRSAKTVGSPCYCYGSSCSDAGYQRPEQLTIYGCDNVAETHQGASRVCLRTTNAPGIEPVIYFTNGMCSHMLAKCEPTSADAAGSICRLAAIGDPEKYDDFTSCANTKDVLIEMTIDVAVMTQTAKLHTKLCVNACESDADCRNTETDPIFMDAVTGRKCHTDTASGKKFCIDPRNAGGKYKVVPNNTIQ